MPSINMIAPRRADKRRLEQAMRKLGILILVELVFVVALGGWVITKSLTTRASIAVLDAQMLELAPKIKAVEALEAKTAKLKPKVELLNEAKERTMRWYNTLDRLTQSVPASTWLTRVSTTTDVSTKDLILSINGLTCEQARVGETMMRLQAIPDFASVDLHFTQKGNQGVAQAVEFEIGARMKGPEQDKPKEVTPNGSAQS